MHYSIMATQFPGHGAADSPTERSGYYWQRAAKNYRKACGAETEEIKSRYMMIAAAWGTLADEIIHRAPALKMRDGQDERTHH